MNTLLAAAVTVLFATALPSQATAPKDDLVVRMIERLGNPRADLADATMVGLIRGGTASVPLLRAVLAKSEAPRVRGRAERALAICAVDAPIVNGLKVGLRADKATLTVGEPVALTVTLCNVSDAPIALYLGMSYSGNVLENGLALRSLGAGEQDPSEQARFGNVGFCGTGAFPIVVVLAPWTSQEFGASATFAAAAEKGGCIDHAGPHLNMGLAYLPVPENAEVVRLQVHHAVETRHARGMIQPTAKPDWEGTMVSNELRLALRAR